MLSLGLVVFSSAEPSWWGRSKGRVTSQCCAEYCLASLHHPLPPGRPQVAAGPTLGALPAPQLQRSPKQQRGVRGGGREQQTHAGSQGAVGASAEVSGHRRRWSGRAVSDMLGVGTTATRGLVTPSCSLYLRTLTL